MALAATANLTIDKISEALGDKSDYLLNHKATAIPKESLYLPGPDYMDTVFTQTDRSPQVLRSLSQMLNHGRLAGTGYLSILPVD